VEEEPEEDKLTYWQVYYDTPQAFLKMVKVIEGFLLWIWTCDIVRLT
jgi:hypothetical protein